jgi:hypothetical protein
MVGDYNEALEHQRQASILLRVVRAQEGRGANAEVDAALDELQKSVDKTRDVLEEEATSDSESDESAGDESDGSEETARCRRQAARACSGCQMRRQERLESTVW